MNERSEIRTLVSKSNTPVYGNNEPVKFHMKSNKSVQALTFTFHDGASECYEWK